MPVDISRDHLMDVAEELAAAYPEVEVLPICADFTTTFTLPEPKRHPARTLVYFPGSTIGNFEPAEALGLLRETGSLARGRPMICSMVPAWTLRAPAATRFNPHRNETPEGITPDISRYNT